MDKFIRNPNDIVALLSKWTKSRQENFLEITLNGSHGVIRVHHITKGIANKTLIHPRECFYPAIKDNACAIVFAHNYPSGNVNPSEEDDETNKRLFLASELLGIHLLDNLIIAKGGYFYSYREHGKLERDFDNDDIERYVELVAAERRS